MKRHIKHATANAQHHKRDTSKSPADHESFAKPPPIMNRELTDGILQGIADKKAGRVYKVPNNIDPIEWLHRISKKVDRKE